MLVKFVSHREKRTMSDNVSREAKLKVAADIVKTYVQAAVEKQGESQSLKLTADNICAVLTQVYQTVDQLAPSSERRVGLG
jgi:hypothetical protein